jgi:hypothetical protein
MKSEDEKSVAYRKYLKFELKIYTLEFLNVWFSQLSATWENEIELKTWKV